ncbi:hypothetical protein B0H12DRAFT_805930 [Mycena haematopus]|nr:hypothetical protein B0H12DRAFT_805930 [Mycena haematopus]
MRTHELRRRLSNLDATISHHESILQELKQQRSAILSELDVAVYPVLTLPPEITAKIFVWCLDGGRRPLPSVAPLLLTHICHDWRALALSTPALWDTIGEIEFSGLDRRAGTVVETWFSRAGTRPLSLGIICTEHLDSGCVESVVNHASQLQSLDVMTYADVFSNFIGITSYPILSSLALASSLDGYDGGQIQLFGSHGAPSLRHLSLNTLPPSVMIMPWAQLTKISLTLISLPECLDTLRWAPALCEFHRQGTIAVESAVEQSSVHHSSLLSLAIAMVGGDEDILEFLTLPNLQKLELGGHVYASFLELDIFLSRIAGTLHTFNVGIMRTVPVRWFEPLMQLTTLELVRLTGLQFATDVIRALNRRTSPDLLPKLRSFVLLNCGSNQVDDELLDALDSRCDATSAERAKLESFSLIWPDHDHFKSVARLPLVNVLSLRALAARGMRIHVGTREQNSFY